MTVTGVSRHRDISFRGKETVQSTAVILSGPKNIALRAVGIPHHYDEFIGGHDWEYWQLHLEETLRFFAAQAAMKVAK